MKYLILLYICFYSLSNYLILCLIILDVFLSNNVTLNQKAVLSHKAMLSHKVMLSHKFNMVSHKVMLSHNLMLSCQALRRSAQVAAARRNLGTTTGRGHPRAPRRTPSSVKPP